MISESQNRVTWDMRTCINNNLTLKQGTHDDNFKQLEEISKRRKTNNNSYIILLLIKKVGDELVCVCV